MDIVKRLRKWSSFESTYELLSDAADEIEQLRRSFKIFVHNTKKINASLDKDWGETVHALKAENQRLREEVKELEGVMDKENCAVGYLITKRVLKKHGMWKQTDSE
jgi:methyl-accepting chemotaxis protein